MEETMAPALGEASPNELANTLRRMPLAMAVLDLSSNRLTLVNDSFAALLKLEPGQGEGLDVLSLVPPDDRGVVSPILAGVASGLIESCEGRGRLHSPTGATVDVLASVLPLGVTKPHSSALFVAAPDRGDRRGEPALTSLDAKQMAFGAVDHEWRIAEMSADAADLLDWDRHGLRGTSLHALVHPDDVSLLLLTLARSSTERRAADTRLRVARSDGNWTPVRLAVSPLCDHNPSRFALAMWRLPFAPDSDSSSDDRASRLESHLWRIAVEVQASGISDLPQATPAWWTDPTLRGLSGRQSEILRRLTRGERVPAIARELFVSQSTVRNHLSAIYRRVGVHSQSELLARLMPANRTARAGAAAGAAGRRGVDGSRADR